jgi:hypothetical protein
MASRGDGWFLNFHCFTKSVKVAFFRGTSLRPPPPGESKHKEVRYVDIHEDDEIDQAQPCRVGEAGQPIARRTDVKERDRQLRGIKRLGDWRARRSLPRRSRLAGT